MMHSIRTHIRRRSERSTARRAIGDGRCRAAIVLAVVFFLAAGSLTAQVKGHDTRGTKFWVTFLENWGSLGSSEHSDLRLYASGDTATTVHVTYELTGETIDIALPKPRTSYEININFFFGDSTELVGAEERSFRSFLVESDNEITLYGVNIRSKSSDAFLALPDDVLTRRYVVLAYTNGLNSVDRFNSYYDMASEMAVMATEDGTTVRIDPPQGLRFNDGRTGQTTVTLDRGQVFLMRADTGRGMQYRQDVSGTEVLSNKPVAVFGGNRRTSVPTEVGNFRDHLVEQMPPLDIWGNDALLVPHYDITPATGYTAVARILPVFAGTTWTLNGIPMGPLTLGRPVEIPLAPGGAYVEATGPILVAQYEHSVGKNDPITNEAALGDPFMMLIPPSAQFDTAYAFQSVPHQEFQRHFVNIVVPTEAVTTVSFDGTIIDPNGTRFRQLAATRFSYLQDEVSAGSHSIRADSAFGLYAYGFGPANSYGYVGGMLFKTLVQDFQPPEVEFTRACDSLDGIAFDARITDEGVDSCYAMPDTSNVALWIEPFTSPADTVHFGARLIDPYRDGVVDIRAIDSMGRSLTRRIGLPGFTVRLSGMTDGPLLLDTLVAYNSNTYCRTLRIENYGSTPQVIDSIRIAPDSVSDNVLVRQTFPITIPPGGAADVELCSAGLEDSMLVAHIDLVGGCRDREVAVLPITHRVDTTAPGVIRPMGRCTDDVDLTFTDAYGSGIVEMHFDTLINCTGEFANANQSFPTGRVTAHIRRIDPRQDMIYQVAITDDAGNTIIERDTLGGFTLSILDKPGDTLRVDGTDVWDGKEIDVRQSRCDSLILANHGSQPLVIAALTLRGNQTYSVPPSQFPLTIPPGGHRSVAVCIEGTLLGHYVDTAVVYDFCGTHDDLPVKVVVNGLDGTGTDVCNNTIRAQQEGPAKRTYITTPIPNPAGGPTATVDVALTRASVVSLEIFSSTGQPASTVMRGVEMKPGVTRIEFDVSSLDAGAYFIRLRTADGDVHSQKFIVRR